MDFAEEFVEELLNKSQNPSLQYNTKVKEKTLLLDSKPKDVRGIKNRRKERKENLAKRKALSRKERREMGLDGIPAHISFDFLKPLHKLWYQYVMKLLDGNYLDLERLLKADLHGSLITVVQAKEPSSIGISGIAFRETENMFYIVTKEDLVKKVPKKDHVFTMAIEDFIFTFYGNHIATRPADKISKKFKSRSTIEMM